jgi:hypothetical protein
MIRSLNSLNLRRKFFAWSTLILIAFSLLLSGLYYFHMRSILMQEALDKSEVILQEVESIRDYVKEVLRPKMFELHADDTFIIEAMSTTYVSSNIMRRFGKKMEGYVFRRVSLNPHNPQNRADSFEEDMFDWFEADESRRLWQGIVKKKGKAYFISMLPDYFDSGCLACHGDYRDAPRSLVERYGTDGGFRFQKGDLGGINSVSIPVSAALTRITRDAIIVFLVILASSFLALFLLNLMFGRLVIDRLKMVSASLLHEDISANTKLQAGAQPNADELDSLRLSLKTLTRYVKTARKGSAVQPDFIGPYTIGEPLAAGTLSWLYRATNTGNQQEVTVKQGFADLMVNPVYASCFRAELKILHKVRHANLLSVVGQLDDTLILESFSGKDFEETGTEKIPGGKRYALLQQLCDLVAALHSGGIVHHDLRPGVFLVTDDNSLKLFDMGHASQRDIPDVIHSSGLGPQGDFRYMAPELIQGLRGDPRSDIYSIGVVLYLLMTGVHPLTSAPAGISRWLRLKQNPPSPRTHKASLSPALEEVIMKAMAYDLEERYQWIEDLWEDFEKAMPQGE